MGRDPKALGRVLVETTTDGMKEAARQHGLLTDGKIDLRKLRIRLRHTGLDLREFLFEGADLSNSTLTNCIGESVRFDGCTLRSVFIGAAKGKKVSFRDASFDGTVIADAELGPRTLDLSGTSYRGARLTDVRFTMAKLERADFTGAQLTDASFTSGLLQGASFRNAHLTRVSFERTVLEGADFTGATLEQLEFWGEPNFAGAIISDELRYRYGEVTDSRRKVDALIARGNLGPEATAALRRLRDRYADLLSYPEAMLIGREMEDAIPPSLFPMILKALKNEP